MKLVRKTFNIPVEIITGIEKYQKENAVSTFTAAMLELIRKGLKNKE